MTGLGGARTQVRYDMDRRKFVIGAGALATGSAAAVSTGAFSAAQIDDRDVDIAVRGDDEALIQLVPGHMATEGGTVPENRVDLDDGQLYISFDDSDTDGGGGNGVNPNSVYQVGSIGAQGKNALGNLDGANDGIPGPTTADKILYGEDEDKPATADPAFEIRNESDQNYSMNVAVEAESTPDETEFTAAFVLRSESTGGTDTSFAAAQPISSYPDGYGDDIEVDSGDAVGVSLIVVTENVSPDADLDAEVIIEVGEARGEQTG